ARTARPCMDIAELGARIAPAAALGARYAAEPRRQRAEDRVERVDHLLRAADHHAIAALDPPDAAARADIEIVDAFFRKSLGAADIVLPEAIADIDDRVALVE